MKQHWILIVSQHTERSVRDANVSRVTPTGDGRRIAGEFFVRFGSSVGTRRAIDADFHT